jgi:hypothetical protein
LKISGYFTGRQDVKRIRAHRSRTDCKARANKCHFRGEKGFRWDAVDGENHYIYVLEYAYSYYFGPDGDMVGFNHLNSLGAGLELDTGAWDIFFTRARLMGRYRFGEKVTGWTIGLGISF